MYAPRLSLRASGAPPSRGAPDLGNSPPSSPKGKGKGKGGGKDRSPSPGPKGKGKGKGKTPTPSRAASPAPEHKPFHAAAFCASFAKTGRCSAGDSCPHAHHAPGSPALAAAKKAMGNATRINQQRADDARQTAGAGSPKPRRLHQPSPRLSLRPRRHMWRRRLRTLDGVRRTLALWAKASLWRPVQSASMRKNV